MEDRSLAYLYVIKKPFGFAVAFCTCSVFSKGKPLITL